METKMITIPFEVEKAKKIQAGEEPGKITIRDERNVRIVCWDMNEEGYPIIGIITNNNGKEWVSRFTKAGKYYVGGGENKHDLMLQVPEWTQFKDGDILATESGNSFILNANGEFKTSCYAGLFHDKISFGGAALSDHIEVTTYATDEQKQELIDALKESTDPRGKEYLKRFFGIEEKQECEFEPKDWVLGRMVSGTWCLCQFSHKETLFDGKVWYVAIGGIGYSQCIPYNDQTKHLLGTTDNWEE